MSGNEDIWGYIAKNEKPLWLYGTGNGADKIISELQRRGICVTGIFASDGFVRNRSFRGFPVVSYNEAKKSGDITVLLAFGSDREDVRENVKRIMRENELLIPDVPVYGDTIFTSEFYEANKARFDAVGAALSDDKSKKSLDFIIKAKLSGNPEALFSAECEKNEALKSVLDLSENGIYFDAGAYRGDTIEEYIRLFGGYKKIYAAEPDFKTFGKLSMKYGQKSNIELINAAVSREDGESFYKKGSGRGSHKDTSGEKIICRSIDSILGGSPVSYIKMDIEGAEKSALEGARETIKKYKPKMRIAAYHRSEDLFSIPETVFSLRDDYKIYLRHYPSLPAWDIDFFFV